MPSDAVNPFGPDAKRPPTIDAEDRPQWQVRRDASVWYGVVGIGLLFAGGISSAFSVGGVLMVAFGIFEYTRWSLKRPKEEDPWRDEEIDAWEDHEYGRGGGLDDDAEAHAPEVVDANPDEAWGLHERRF